MEQSEIDRWGIDVVRRETKRRRLIFNVVMTVVSIAIFLSGSVFSDAVFGRNFEEPESVMAIFLFVVFAFWAGVSTALRKQEMFYPQKTFGGEVGRWLDGHGRNALWLIVGLALLLMFLVFRD